MNVSPRTDLGIVKSVILSGLDDLVALGDRIVAFLDDGMP